MTNEVLREKPRRGALLDKHVTSIYRIALALAAIATGAVAIAAEQGTPDAYLPFIQSSGTQYIDTGVNAQSGTKAEIDFKFITLPGDSGGCILGAKNSGDNRFYSAWYKTAGFGYGYGTYSDAGATGAAGTRYTVTSVLDAGAQSFSTNGVQLASGTSANAFNLGRNLYLFVLNNEGTLSSYSSIRLYRCRIWQKDGNGDYQLVRDFKPCQAGYEACLYDEVEGKIYRNSGTGTFTAPLTWPGLSESSITNLTAAAYEPDGLVANFDAISNSGANAPRNPSATSWIDLVAGRTATLTRVAAADPDADPGCWTRDSYRFAGNTYFLFDEELGLGSTYTIQLVSDIEGCNSTSYPMTGNFGVFGAAEGFFFYRGRTSPVQWFATVYPGAAGYGVKYFQGNWNGRRATVMRDGTLISMAFNSERVAPAAANSFSINAGATPAKRWMIGNYNGSVNAALVGRVHAVRIYNRTLTQDEIARNWAIDNARFHDLPAPWNMVLVESSIPGAEGTEPCGVYAVSGSHTFTAPATVAVGGNTYRCTGYIYEKYRTTSDTWYAVWETPEYREGETSFAFSAAADDDFNSARITWRWELADGVEKIDTGLYGQSGLVANWDGIRNAGAAAAHDLSAEVWRDASGNGLDATRFVPDDAAEGAGSGAWTDNGYSFVGNDQFRTVALLELGPQFTWEIVTDSSASTANGRYLFGTKPDSSAAYTWSENNFYITTGQSKLVVHFKETTAWSWGGKYVTAMFNYDRQGWANGAVVPTFYQPSGGYGSNRTTSQHRWNIGGIGTAPKAFVGDVLAVRLYDRMIPAVELAASRELDEIRFRGKVQATNAVYVATALPGAEGDQECGIYRVAGSAHVFSATQRRKVGGVGYAATRCTVEMWNAASGEWENPVASAGSTWTTPA
ncbi:MAG: hypothetical protein IJ146_14130, partial [Kiritimatiellae bacterium]|nr:hypothetical protein [Kiritimatiellia bacterium]